jgi:predicted regulator of Ras-like GTPase activity (Roadblock/LC7/MglB family)
MFGQVLSEVVAGVDGAVGVILMGSDGIAVDQALAKGTDWDVETIGMEVSVLVREVHKAVGQINAGTAEELMIRGSRIVALVRILNEEFFIVLALSPGGSIGKGRFALRRAAPRLVEALL